MADEYVLPDPNILDHARSSIISKLPGTGIGLDAITRHLHQDIVPGLNRCSESSRYYGFVIGGATPAAILADNLVTLHDQNLAIHLPRDGVATDVEDGALHMVCDLLELDPADWPHRTFTTGATASNILGMACAREHVIAAAAAKTGHGDSVSLSEYGVVEAMRRAGVDEVQILATEPHSSLRKAAGILGLGRANVRDVGRRDAPLRFDLTALREALSKPRCASIVAVSCSEVNTGEFATDGADLREIRKLCNQYGAWLHIDAAFGLLARILPATEEYAFIREGVAEMHLADSITGDGHKMLNVPYDCGFFLSRHLPNAISVFQNPNAAYLATAPDALPSPCNIGLENSRRFRALPVYATLAAYGRDWYAEMLQRQMRLAREIAGYILSSTAFELLPVSKNDGESAEQRLRRIYMVVMFRARDARVNEGLIERVNSQRRVYISGTKWEGKPAARFAVANWQVDVARDLAVVKEVLEAAIR